MVDLGLSSFADQSLSFNCLACLSKSVDPVLGDDPKLRRNHFSSKLFDDLSENDLFAKYQTSL